jgi:hypothetical protein
MTLKFPELRGGTVQGLNDAGVENFQGAIDVYLSRECGQNTTDAPARGVETVRLEFDRLDMPAADIPAFDEIKATLNACLERWKGKEKEREFFETAVALASQKEIPVLRVSDYGTTGLTGDDIDEAGRWFALVKSQGVSNKGDTAGGSFGIGKSSPFAASRFRTVIYGTRTEAGATAIQGVSRLVTHIGPDGKLTQGVGFIGDYDPTGGEDGGPVFRAVRGEAKIPVSLKRTDPGTDIWIIGYRSGSEWSNDLIRSILSNFWPAIHRGKIQFRVGAETISKDNLGDLIARHIGEEEFEAHYFYKAVSNEPARAKLKYTGKCELFLTAATPDLPRRICMVRNTGMRIYDYQPKACRVPFSGLFVCTDPEGNKLLRKLEPPKHNAWDAKRVEDGTGKKALDEIKLWIREEVKKLNPLFVGSTFNENELAKYLPDTPDDPSELPQDEVGASNEESLESKPKKEDVSVTQLQTKVVTPVFGNEPGGGTGPGHTGESGGGDGGTGSGGTDKGKTKSETKPPRFRVRSFRVGGPGTYEVILRSKADFTGPISIFAVGEDGRHEDVVLTGATLTQNPGQRLKVRGNVIDSVPISAGVPLRVTIQTDELDRRSLTANATT